MPSAKSGTTKLEADYAKALDLYATLRLEYPHAGPSTETIEYEYCVGGALCLKLSQEENFKPSNDDEFLDFPLKRTLILALTKANPLLSKLDASGYAKDIIAYNDQGETDLAWISMQGALLWGH